MGHCDDCDERRSPLFCGLCPECLSREDRRIDAATLEARRLYALVTRGVETGLRDKNGVKIKAGDFVSLDGNMTADDSLGVLPNGWTFDETDVYEVYFDERISKYSLKLGVEPDSAYNAKYMNHAVSLLHDSNVEIVPATQPTACP